MKVSLQSRRLGYGILWCTGILFLFNFEIIFERLVYRAQMALKTILKMIGFKTIASKRPMLFYTEDSFSKYAFTSGCVFISKMFSNHMQNLWSTNAEVVLNHAVDFNIMNIWAKDDLNSFVFTAKFGCALTAAMVNKVQNGIKDTTAIICTISTELSKRPILSAKANKKPFNLYKKTKCSFLTTESMVLQYLHDEAIGVGFRKTRIGYCNQIAQGLIIVIISIRFLLKVEYLKTTDYETKSGYPILESYLGLPRYCIVFITKVFPENSNVISVNSDRNYNNVVIKSTLYKKVAEENSSNPNIIVGIWISCKNFIIGIAILAIAKLKILLMIKEIYDFGAQQTISKLAWPKGVCCFKGLSIIANNIAVSGSFARTGLN